MADSIWQVLGETFLGFLTTEAKDKPELEVRIPIGEPAEATVPDDGTGIDWTKATASITPHFTVGEMAVLHSWNRLATLEDGLTDEVKNSLIELCQKMEQVRTELGCGLNVHCGFRSVKYNQEVLNSLPNDVHSRGQAIDWDASPHYTIEQAKEKVRPLLEKLGLRLEDGTTTWLHNDIHPVGPSGREFKA